MSNKLVKENNGAVVNPFVKNVLTLEVTSDGNITLQSSLPPNEVCKTLSGIIINLQFQHMYSVIDEMKKSFEFQGRIGSS